MEVITKTTNNTKVVFLPEKKSTLEDYARAYLAEGYSPEAVEELVIGLLWSSLFLGEQPKQDEE